MSFSEYTIHVDQLCVGLYIRADSDNKTLRKGFKIKNSEQIEKIRRLGLSHVTCILNKSDRMPIPVGTEDLRTPPPSANKPAQETAAKSKTPISRELFG